MTTLYPSALTPLYPSQKAALRFQNNSAPRFGGDEAETEPQERKFYEARPNRMFIALGKHFGCALIRAMGMKVTINEEDKVKLRGTKGDPNHFHILNANHSSDLDIMTLAEATRQAGIHFTAMGAIEVFEPEIMGRKWPIVGKFLQRCGVFSVDRESRDKSQTLNAAKEAVKKGSDPLAGFPEGYVTFTNMVVEEMKDGFARIGIAVAEETGKDVKITPLSFYFHSRNNISDTLKTMLGELEVEVEKRLNITLKPQPTVVERIRYLAKILIDERELFYKQKYPKIKTLADIGKTTDNHFDRLEHLREAILDHLESEYLSEVNDKTDSAQLELFPKDRPDGKHEIRARRLIGHIRRQQTSRENLSDLLENLEGERQNFLHRKPDQKIRGILRKTYEQVKSDLKALSAQNGVYQEDIATLKQIMNLTMYPKNYLGNDAQQNRLMETIAKLYRDIMGLSDAKMKKMRMHLLREARIEACVSVGEAISVNQSREAFALLTGEKKLSFSEYITERVRERIQQGILKQAEEKKAL